MLAVGVILGVMLLPPLMALAIMHYCLRLPADVHFQIDDELDV